MKVGATHSRLWPADPTLDASPGKVVLFFLFVFFLVATFESRCHTFPTLACRWANLPAHVCNITCRPSPLHLAIWYYAFLTLACKGKNVCQTGHHCPAGGLIYLHTCAHVCNIICRPSALHLAIWYYAFFVSFGHHF